MRPPGVVGDALEHLQRPWPVRLHRITITLCRYRPDTAQCPLLINTKNDDVLDEVLAPVFFIK